MRHDDSASFVSAATRRQYLKLTGGAFASLALSLIFTAPWVRRTRKSSHSGSPIPFHLGLASYSLRNFDLDRALAMTHRVGLDRICLKSMHLPLDSKPAEIAAASRQGQAGGVGPLRRRCHFHEERARYCAGVRIRQGRRNADDHRCPGSRSPAALDEHVKKYDITVAIHNHGPGDRYFPTPQSVYDAVKSLDHRIGLCIDIGHTVRIGADLLGSIRSFGDRLFDLHIKDVTAATPQGKGRRSAAESSTSRASCARLIDVKFKGVAAFEYEEQPDDPLPGLAESVGYMKGVLATI